MTTGQFLTVVGLADAHITAAARAARSQIQALDSLSAFEQRSTILVTALLEDA